MRSLSGLEAKIIIAIASAPIALTVRGIAKRCFMTQQTAASTLGKLRALDLVRASKGKDRRKTLYSLADSELRQIVTTRL